MDSDRKYGQRGYQDSDRGNGRPFKDDRFRDERFGGPRNQGPKPSIDITGPRLPRLVQSVAASRCWNCSATLPMDMDFRENCPKCNSALHCCKQCTHFEPSTRFQCLKPIPERVNKKDQNNECTFFKPRVTVARDTPQAKPGLGGLAVNGANGQHANGNGHASRPLEEIAKPRNAQDARAAFDSLFKK
jgi:hypothetical protein